MAAALVFGCQEPAKEMSKQDEESFAGTQEQAEKFLNDKVGTGKGPAAPSGDSKGN
jgi:hypothetical protein